MSNIEMQKEIARITAENNALREQAKATKLATKLGFKVSEKGAVSVYGMGRFPVTLYMEQWERLLGHTPELKAFIEANRSKLVTKQ